MNTRMFTLTFEDDMGDRFTHDVLVEWEYSPGSYWEPDESYALVLNLDELPDWITEEMVFDKLNPEDFGPEEQEYDPDR